MIAKFEKPKFIADDQPRITETFLLLSAAQEKDFSIRAKRAHERMHGQSTWIEARYMPHCNRVRVHDHELNIVTYWDVHKTKRRKITFAQQMGERS